MKLIIYGLIFIIIGNIMLKVTDFESVVISFLGVITTFVIINDEKKYDDE